MQMEKAQITLLYGNTAFTGNSLSVDGDVGVHSLPVNVDPVPGIALMLFYGVGFHVAIVPETTKTVPNL